MANWRKYIPARVKLFARLNQRRCADLFTGRYKRFARNFFAAGKLHEVAVITQPLHATDASANKYHNLSLALEKLNNITVQPGELFSFWQLVGDPSEEKGYKKSRTIVNGTLQASAGGGLCQLSGLIYFLALQAGLDITERHAHSMDIYKEEERYAPLGSDATVSFGYKDLRFINNLSFSVTLQFQLTPVALSGRLSASQKTTAASIEFVCMKEGRHAEVITLRLWQGRQTVLARDRYQLLYI